MLLQAKEIIVCKRGSAGFDSINEINKTLLVNNSSSHRYTVEVVP